MKVGDPTDTLFADGVIVPGTPEEMQKQEEAAKQRLAELHKQRLEAARGRRYQCLAYSSKAKSWTTVSIETTFTNAGLNDTPRFGSGLPRDKDMRF